MWQLTARWLSGHVHRCCSYRYIASACTHIVQGCQLAGAGGYNIGKFDQATFSVDSDSNVVISYSGGDDMRYVCT